MLNRTLALAPILPNTVPNYAKKKEVFNRTLASALISPKTVPGCAEKTTVLNRTLALAPIWFKTAQNCADKNYCFESQPGISTDFAENGAGLCGNKQRF